MKKKREILKSSYKWLVFIIPLIYFSCTNPFAPGLSDIEDGSGILGDQKTIEGVFENFKYSYIFKDTLVYGQLLDHDFNFIFRNYDRGVDVSWGREEDMLSTNRMFNASQSLDLVWNEIVSSIGDSVIKDISRAFTLTIVFSPTDYVRIQGRANFRLARNTTAEIWKIKSWRDESNY